MKTFEKNWEKDENFAKNENLSNKYDFFSKNK